MKWFFIMILFYSSLSFSEELKIGRLFFSPKERAELNRLRIQAEQAKYTQTKETDLPIPSFLNLRGFVTNNKGKNVVWFDNKQPIEELNIPGLRLDIQNVNVQGLPIQIINGDKQLKLKPGQHLDTTNGKIIENYYEPPPQPDDFEQKKPTP
ncbi:MAG: hypothetical protein RIT27_809 [Pseudomonadota bacterium]|jgi:hypothetical protein